MIPESTPAPTPGIQADVARAFLMRQRRVFERKDRQVYAIVGSNRDMRVVSEVWFSNPDSGFEFKEVLVHVLELIRSEGLRYWLVDLRFAMPDFHGQREWLVNTLMPAAFEAGLKRGAAVVSESSAVRDGDDLTESLFAMLGGMAAGPMLGFKDIELARRWLLHGELPPAEKA